MSGPHFCCTPSGTFRLESRADGSVRVTVSPDGDAWLGGLGTTLLQKMPGQWKSVRSRKGELLLIPKVPLTPP